MPRFHTQWELIVTANDAEAYAEAVDKIRADAAHRLADVGEEWTVIESPLTFTVTARVAQTVADLDDAA